MEDQMERVANLTRMAAQQMLRCGGEIYRVEEIIHRLGKAFGYEAESIAFTTGITMTFRDPQSGRSCSLIGRVDTRTVDMTRLARVNELSRALCEHRMTLEDAEKELQDITRMAALGYWMGVLFAAGSAAFFALMFGGGWFDFLAAGVCGGLVKLVCELLPKRTGIAVYNMVSGFLTALCAHLLVFLFVMGDVDRIIVSTLMPFLPGLSFTNAIRDGLNGDLISGGARLSDALTQAVILAGGVGVGLWVWMRLAGGAGI